jgi:hypothetical protein
VTGFTNAEENVVNKYEAVSVPSGPGSCQDAMTAAGGAPACFFECRVRECGAGGAGEAAAARARAVIADGSAPAAASGVRCPALRWSLDGRYTFLPPCLHSTLFIRVSCAFHHCCSPAARRRSRSLTPQAPRSPPAAVNCLTSSQVQGWRRLPAQRVRLG